MALIFCTQCQNEYDSHIPYCPYCKHPTPLLDSIKNKKPFVLMLLFTFFAVVMPLVIVQTSQHPIDDENSYTQPQTITPAPAPSEFVAAMPEEPQAQELDSSVLERYTHNANLLLNAAQTNNPITLPALTHLDVEGNTLTHQFDKTTQLIITLSSDHQKIESITIISTKARTHTQTRLANINAPLLAAILPRNTTSLEDMQAQLEYLHQLAQTSPRCASYMFEDFYLTEIYNKKRNTMEISLSTNPIKNLNCK